MSDTVSEIIRQANAAPPKSLTTPRSTEELITERKTTHGDFAENARISQTFKDTARNEKGWGNLNDVQREALDMIFLKISRVLSNNPNFNDHWDDIAGYAKLVSERI